MLPKQVLQVEKDARIMNTIGSKRVSAARISVASFALACLFVLIFVCSGRGLGAQAQADAAKTPANVADDTKTKLANEWLQPNGVEHVLKALQLLTRGSDNPYKTNLEVLVELKAGDPDDEDLYRAAMGVPDLRGQPTVQGLPDFLDTLAKANNLDKADEVALFKSTQEIIDHIYKDGPGKLALVRVNDSFSQHYNYLGLYQLLDAEWRHNKDPKNLETLRAAFQTNTDSLAKQVAGKITAAKK